MLRRFLDPGPIDTLRVAQILVLQNGYRAGINFLERAKPERDQRRFHYVQRRKVLGQSSSAYHLQISKIR